MYQTICTRQYVPAVVQNLQLSLKEGDTVFFFTLLSESYKITNGKMSKLSDTHVQEDDERPGCTYHLHVNHQEA